MSVELHCHSIYSVDGRGTPEDLVDVAAERGITTLALTDHNCLGGVERAAARARMHSIRFLTGVELDARWNGRSYHFIALGFDPEDQRLDDLAKGSFSIYGHTFGLCVEQFAEMGWPDLESLLLERLPDRYPTHPSPVLNQWYARDLLIDEGIFPDREAFGAFIQQARARVEADHGSDDSPRFPDLERVLPVVHDAGGILVLAHVAYQFPGDEATQVSVVRDLVAFGLDGFELHHPSNLSEPHFDRLVELADELECVTTGGSDCHDCSQQASNPIGCSGAPDGLTAQIDAALAARHAG